MFKNILDHNKFKIYNLIFTIYNSKDTRLNIDQETGLYYYGARYYSPTLSIWASVDPMSDKYPSLSPYAYCANNPVILVDPNGREINPASVDEWNKQKQNISNKRDEFKGHALINKLSGGKLFQKETDRYNRLGNTLNTMDIMESSTQMYSLEVTTGNTGETRMNKNGSITLSFSSTALFTHEVTHGGQYESRDIGFLNSLDNMNGKGIALDYWDEFEAYDAQAAYDPNSLPNKSTPSGTKEWLLGIKGMDYSNHGQYPLNGNSKIEQVNFAYPKSNNRFMRNLSMKYIGDFNFKK